MQAMILAAGIGKRMLPLSSVIPKPLLKIKGEPIIVHLIKSLKDNGVNRIVINLFHLKEQIRNFLQDGRKYGVEILYSEEQELLDTGGGIVNALHLLNDEPFIVVSSDVYSNYKFSSLQQSLTKFAHLVFVNNPPFNMEGDFSLERNRIYLSGNNMLTYANIGIFSKEFFADPPEKNFPLNFFIKRAIMNNMITGEKFAGMWHNIGTLDLLKAAEQA